MVTAIFSFLAVYFAISLIDVWDWDSDQGYKTRMVFWLPSQSLVELSPTSADHP